MKERVAELICPEWNVPSIGRWVGLSDDQVRSIIRQINHDRVDRDQSASPRRCWSVSGALFSFPRSCDHGAGLELLFAFWRDCRPKNVPAKDWRVFPDHPCPTGETVDELPGSGGSGRDWSGKRFAKRAVSLPAGVSTSIDLRSDKGRPASSQIRNEETESGTENPIASEPANQVRSGRRDIAASAEARATAKRRWPTIVLTMQSGCERSGEI